MSEEFVSLARVVRPQGRHGEVIAELRTNVREQFTAIRKMSALDADGTRRILELEAHRFHQGRVVLKFRGIDSINQAEELRDCELQVTRAELLPLAAGSHYVKDLVGCLVFDRGRKVGEISAVQFGSGEAPLLEVRTEKKNQVLIPFAEAYLVSADIGRKRIDMALPEGLLEVDAALTEEEKQAQRRRE
ncbi:MAG: ribosome maturation factor RimM [Acidobacteriales bacterium]|nr:ribosome maturation factor RimM [Terriglobales bacterium]